MDSNIVHEFENLHVFVRACNIAQMDELVQDLTNALEESSKSQKSQSGEGAMLCSVMRRQIKKRRGMKRRSNPLASWDYVSGASESSLDEAASKDRMDLATAKDLIENMVIHSDSDEVARRRRLVAISIPLPSSQMIPVESDSVTENFSPLQPHRRRRKFKSMAVDPIDDNPVCNRGSYKQIKSRSLRSVNQSNIASLISQIAASNGGESVIPGKRKRNSKSKCEYIAAISSSAANQNTMYTAKDSSTTNQEVCSQESSISSSASDSESGILTNDEAREADDEQSDFFHEPGPSCGIHEPGPSCGIVPWWEDQKGENMETDAALEKIMIGSFEHLPRSSQNSFKARMKKLLDNQDGREFRSGRRKLKEKIPGYTMSRFLQDRQNWSMIQSKFAAWQGCTQKKDDNKRRRRTPPLESPEGFIGENIPMIPDTNIGGRMLPGATGWCLSSGLGMDCENSLGLAFLRPRSLGSKGRIPES